MHEFAIDCLKRYNDDVRYRVYSFHDDIWDEQTGDNTTTSNVVDIKSLALGKMAQDPSLNDAQQLLVRLCMAELEGKGGLAGVTLTTAEMDILTGLLANSIVAQEKKEEN